jgi:hypothetical protein
MRELRYEKAAEIVKLVGRLGHIFLGNAFVASS